MKLTFTEVTAPQRSDEWFAARAGRLTGSAARDMLAKIKTGEAAARRDLRVKLALEQLTGLPERDDVFQNEHTLRGVEKEPDARMWFEETTGLIVRETGFLKAEGLMVGCSLDGDIGEYEEIVEFKCPKTSTHIGYLTAGVLPDQYKAQVMHNLWVTGAKRAHFVSFDDRLPGKLQGFHVVVEREDLPIDGYIREALQFINEVDELHHFLKRKAV